MASFTLGGKKLVEPNHHADKETHMGHTTYLRPQGHRSKKCPGWRGGQAQEPTLESLLRKGHHLLVGAWGTLCQGSSPGKVNHPESSTMGGAPARSWRCPGAPIIADTLHQAPNRPPPRTPAAADPQVPAVPIGTRDMALVLISL